MFLFVCPKDLGCVDRHRAVQEDRQIRDASGLLEHVQDVQEMLSAAYRERRDTMLGLLPAITPPATTWTDPDGGMFVWVTLAAGIDTARLLPVALRHDVAFVPGAPFHAGRPDHGTLRLSFTSSTPAEITEGMRRLGAALDSACTAAGGGAELSGHPGAVKEHEQHM
jgi:2-aminoadipate transaminase